MGFISMVFIALGFFAIIILAIVGFVFFVGLVLLIVGIVTKLINRDKMYPNVLIGIGAALVGVIIVVVISLIVVCVLNSQIS